MGQKSKLSIEQRVQLVVQLLSKEEPAAQIARRAGISEQTLYRWRDDFINGGKQSLNARGTKAEQAKAMERLNAQVAERDQVIGELTIANRVLKNPRRPPTLPGEKETRGFATLGRFRRERPSNFWWTTP